MKKYYQGKPLKQNKAEIKKKNFETYLGIKVWKAIKRGVKKVSWDEFVKNAPK